MDCPYCQSEHVVKKGFNQPIDGPRVQRYLCRDCQSQFNPRSGTPMSGLRQPPEQVAKALKMRSEGMGIRATARVEEVSHSTIIRWERRLVSHEQSWSPVVPENGDVTVEGDELYTKVEKNRPASKVSVGP